MTTVRVATSVLVDRPAAEAFAYLMDAANNPRWQPDVEHASQDGPAAVGTRITELRWLCGQRVRTTFEIIEHDPPRRAVVRSCAGPISFRASYTVTPAGHHGGAHVELTGEVEQVALPPLALHLARRRLDATLQASARNLARELSDALRPLGAMA